MNINFCVEISITQAQFQAPLRCLFKGGVYFEIAFFKSLTTVTVNHLEMFKRNLKF